MGENQTGTSWTLLLEQHLQTSGTDALQLGLLPNYWAAYQSHWLLAGFKGQT
jgi:hypothetical protein